MDTKIKQNYSNATKAEEYYTTFTSNSGMQPATQLTYDKLTT
jgi:hypothetical protein